MSALVDTNVLVYRHDPRDPAKQRVARALLREGLEQEVLRIPHQAIVEFVQAVTRPVGRGGAGLLTRAEALREAEELLAQFEILYPTESLLRTAIRAVATYQLSWFDAHLRAYGEFIQRLAGRFVTTTDVGTTTAEVDRWADFTRYLVGTSPARGGSGDTSALTSVTVMHGMRAALQVAFGSDAFAGRRIVVVGVGKVGGKVAEAAARAGARVAVADVRTDAAAALAARIEGEVIDANTAYAAECDVLSPNALGGVLSPETIPHLRCRVVCGGANNQLLHDPEDAALLAARGIVYAPDYVINSGGLINAAVEREGYAAARARRLANGVYDTTLAILTAAQQDGISTAEAAARRVRARLAAARRQD